MKNDAGQVKEIKTEAAASGSVPALKKAYCEPLDGLRGFAIVLMVLSHCSILNQGGVANAIFFSLSGFLFINPFKDDYDKRFLKITNVLKYYRGRALRILPVYYLTLLLIFIFSKFSVIPKDDFIKILYFGESYRHLWYLYALVRVILIVPFIMMILCFLATKIKILNNDLVMAVVVFVIASIIRRVWLYIDWFDIRLYQFLLGVCAAYVFRYIRKNEKLMNTAKKLHVVGEILIIMLFLLIVGSSNSVMKRFDPSKSELYVGWTYIFISACIMSILVILIAMFPDGITGKILSTKPFLVIGKLSLPIYILNNFVRDQIHVTNKYYWFLCVISVCVIAGSAIDFATSKFISLFNRKKAKA